MQQQQQQQQPAAPSPRRARARRAIRDGGEEQQQQPPGRRRRPRSTSTAAALLQLLLVLLLGPSRAGADAGTGGSGASAGGGRRLVEVYHPFPFTPEGLIRQLQHAQQAVQRGSLSLALVGKDGVVLAGERRDRSPLLAPGPSPKIGILDKHVAYVMSGIEPDGRYLVKRGRVLAQRHWFEFGDEIGLPALCHDLARVVTSAHYRAPSPRFAEGGKRRDLLDEVRAQPSVDALGDPEAAARKEGLPARHFGVGFLLAGPETGYASPGCSLSPAELLQGDERDDVDVDRPAPPAWALYELGPSGLFLRWDARAIGEGAERAEALLERLYRPGLPLEEAKRLAVRVCDAVLDEEGGKGDGDGDGDGVERPPVLEVAVLARDAEGIPRLTRLASEEVRRLRAEVAEAMGLADPASLR